ncbi:hypothetical protein UF75_5054 [Desulfosporosinus sp. I2]|uniref:hypothetical protein n=1 Tax=Desulfosporosinus sp. I2 TaxID=1617025 RepID=UPI0005EDF7AE|nr:hypothetical protein [Desulfosporosinus sp. I2]KJR44571.1 hypothetical protein UF75_5054 [Desulfosporosinus sp. I2]
MNKKIKDIVTGIGISGISVFSSANIVPGIRGCTGSCGGACGFACLVPIVGISSLMLFSSTREKFKFKPKKMG